MKTVQILLSTYNGQNYIKEQLDSILMQTYPEIALLIRDDGSSDKTVAILKDYEKDHENIRLIQGENIGVTASFFALLQEADADYIAFSDQDDIWMTDKVATAVAAIEAVEDPDREILYCGDTHLVDGDGNPLPSPEKGKIRPGFGNALVENICTGCTALINRALADDIKAHLPQHAILHDWWCYLVASHHGVVIYDETPHIHYRQHGDNEVGGSTNAFSRIHAQMRYIKKNKGKLSRQLEEFADIYGNMANYETESRLLQQVLAAKSFGGAIRFCGNHEIYRQREMDELPMRLLFLAKQML